MPVVSDQLRLAERMSRLGTETAFEVLVRAKALEQKGRDVIHLEIGEPDFDTPPNIVEAAVNALHAGYTHYNPAAGLPELRQAIAAEIASTRGVDVSAGEVVVMPGGKPIIFFTMLALVDRGDEVIFPDPGFPIYQSMIEFVGGKAVPLPLREEREFRLDVDELRGRITPRTRLIIVNSPQNPTGGVLTSQDVRELAGAIAGRDDIMVLSDEIYNRLIFEGRHHSIISLPGFKERTILLDGFSKTYAMTGWRLGYGVMRADLAAKIGRLATNCHSCTATFSQMAAIEALKGGQSAVATMREAFRERRDYFIERVNQIKGFHCIPPHGAFYAFANITQTGWKSKDLADALLEETGVALLSGTAFGAHGEGYVRFSIANSIENIAKALDRIDQWTKRRL